MILGILGSRHSSFKVTGPVIEAAQRRGHRIIVYRGRDAKDPVTDEDILQRFPNICVLGPDTLGVHCDVFVGPQLSERPRRPPAKLYVSLDAMWEQANAPVRRDVIQCYASHYQRYLAQGEGPVTGSTVMDAFGVIDRNRIRARYDLATKPVFLFFSAKLRVPHAWRRWIYRYLHYRALVWDLRRWCDTHGYAFVVKTRAKHGDPGFLARYTDRVIGDEDLWPHTSAQLLSVASLALHFQSNASLEAAVAAVPQYSVRLPQPHLQGFRTTKEVYSGHAFTIGHWPRVIRLLDAVQRMEPFVVDPVERMRYVDRYLGPSDDFKSSERVMDVVES